MRYCAEVLKEEIQTEKKSRYGHKREKGTYRGDVAGTYLIFGSIYALIMYDQKAIKVRSDTRSARIA